MDSLFGELQALKLAPIDAALERSPLGSLDVKRKVGVRSRVLPEGPEAIVVFGGVESSL